MKATKNRSAPIASAVLDALLFGPASQEDLAMRTGFTKAQVRGALDHLKRMRMVSGQVYMVLRPDNPAGTLRSDKVREQLQEFVQWFPHVLLERAGAVTISLTAEGMNVNYFKPAAAPAELKRQRALTAAAVEQSARND